MSPSPDLAGFRCLQCGNCCRQPGYVRLRPGEPQAIARFLGLPLPEFMRRFTRLTNDRRDLSLTERADQSCVFLSPANRCEIQAVKPAQCRDFPHKWRYEDCESICRGVRELRRSHERKSRARKT